MKKEIYTSIIKNLVGGSMFAIGILIIILGVTAFESLTTTPGDTGNQSLGSQILSKLSSGGYDRTTDSLEAISDKIDASSGGGIFTKCQVKQNSTAIYPTCPSGFTSIHTYSSAHIYSGFHYTNIEDNTWIYNGVQAMLSCTVCEKN